MPQSGKMNKTNGPEHFSAMVLSKSKTKKCLNPKETLLPSSMRLSNMELMLLEWPVHKPETLLMMPISLNKQPMPPFSNYQPSRCSWQKLSKNRKTIELKTIKIRKFLNSTLSSKAKSNNKSKKLKQHMIPWFIVMSLSAVSTSSLLSRIHISLTVENPSLVLT